MKKIVIGLCFLSLTSSVFAQKVLYAVKVKEKDVPEEVVSAVEKDFKNYSVIEYTAVPVTVVEDKIILTDRENFDPSDYDSYEVKLSGKNKSMKAYYDSDGRLVSTYENIKNTALPHAIDNAIFKKYPKATLESDRYVATHYLKDHKTVVHYHVKIENNGKKHRMYIDGNGNILKDHIQII